MAHLNFDEVLITGIIVGHSTEGITVDAILAEYEKLNGRPFSHAYMDEKYVAAFLHRIRGVYCFRPSAENPLWFFKCSVSDEIKAMATNRSHQSVGMDIATPSVNRRLFLDNLNDLEHGERAKKNGHDQYNISDDSAVCISQPKRMKTPTNEYRPREEKRAVSSNAHKKGLTTARLQPSALSSNIAVHVEGAMPNRRVQEKLFPDKDPRRYHWKSQTKCKRPFHPPNHRRAYGSCKNDTEDMDSGSFMYGYELMGDDFFLELMNIEMKRKFTKHAGIRKCGQCVSGLSIEAATKRMRGITNARIILNVGSIDILHGRDSVDMHKHFANLVNTCRRQNIDLIITTLAPLANRIHLREIANQVKSFNQHLIKKYSATFKVIDINQCMVDKNGYTIFACYQHESKYVTGSNQPHVLWNRIGRQRVLQLIKKNIVD